MPPADARAVICNDFPAHSHWRLDNAEAATPTVYINWGKFGEYELLLSAVLADDVVEPAERALLASYAAENRVSDALHARLLEKAGWTEDEYREGSRVASR